MKAWYLWSVVIFISSCFSTAQAQNEAKQLLQNARQNMRDIILRLPFRDITDLNLQDQIELQFTRRNW